MANVVLFHSIYGLRPGVLEAADRLRGYGHTVQTPDLFDGALFSDMDEAQAFEEKLGTDALLARAWSAVAGLPAELVYSGFSLGGWVAENILLQRPGAVAALLFSAAIPLDQEQAWPSRVPADVHYAEGDPYTEQADVDSLRESVTVNGGTFTAYRYTGGHLFADPELPGYNAGSAELMWPRTAEFLGRL